METICPCVILSHSRLATPAMTLHMILKRRGFYSHLYHIIFLVVVVVVVTAAAVVDDDDYGSAVVVNIRWLCSIQKKLIEIVFSLIKCVANQKTEPARNNTCIQYALGVGRSSHGERLRDSLSSLFWAVVVVWTWTAKDIDVIKLS